MSLTFDIIDCGGIQVAHADHLDGGGPRTWPNFVELVRARVGPVEHAFEWCAGPAYIGFALLGSGLCQRLTVADINPDAVAACRETVERNGLQDRVSVYLSDNLTDVPASEQWDLVIGDPPHFSEPLQRHIDEGFELRSVDPDWAIHRRFFDQLGAHLRPGSWLVLSESRVAGDHDEMFADMIRSAGLELVAPVLETGFNRRYCFIARAPIAD